MLVPLSSPHDQKFNDVKMNDSKETVCVEYIYYSNSISKEKKDSSMQTAQVNEKWNKRVCGSGI